MFRIKHLIPTAAVVIASAGVAAPAALAQADGLYPNPTANTRVVGIVDYATPPEHQVGRGTRYTACQPRSSRRPPWR